MAALTKYADSDSTKDPGSDDEKSGQGKKGNNGKGQQPSVAGSSNPGKRKHPDGGSELVANTNTRSSRAKGKTPINLEEILSKPCPEHSRPDKPARHTWGDCSIMQQFQDYILQRHRHDSHGPLGGSAPGSSGAGFGAGGSETGYQGQSDHGGHNQQFGDGSQQQNNQSGYLINPKQLGQGQYHA